MQVGRWFAAVASEFGNRHRRASPCGLDGKLDLRLAAVADEQQIGALDQDRDQRLVDHRIGADEDDRSVVAGRHRRG